MNGAKGINATSTAPSQYQSRLPSSLHSRNARFEDPAPNSEDSTPRALTDSGIHSEGGHDLTKIRPLAKHRGSSVATFFNGLFTTVIALATLGTSITFSFVLSNQNDLPDDTSRYDKNSVQFFLALSWLFFLLTLAVASLGSTLLTFFRKHWVRDWDGEHGRHSQLTVQLYAVSASAIMGGLIIAAFILMCLVVVAYQPVVGWIALGFTSFFGVIVVISIFNQVPWPWVQGRIPNTGHSDSSSSA